jgi:hypothetical protein
MTSRRGHRVGGGKAEGSNFAKCDDSLAQCLPAFLLEAHRPHSRRAIEGERPRRSGCLPTASEVGIVPLPFGHI